VLRDSPAALGGFTSTPRGGALSPAGAGLEVSRVQDPQNWPFSPKMAKIPKNAYFRPFPGSPAKTAKSGVTGPRREGLM